MKLNRQQSLAALPTGGVECIIAGAGTGKTRTLIAKVKNIISSGIVSPEQILVLTFSRRAADEIKERIRHDLGGAADAITAGTFHSFCLSFLKSSGDSYKRTFGYERFPSVIEEEERLRIYRELVVERIDRFLGIPAPVICGIIHSSNHLDTYFSDKLERFGILSEFDEIRNQYNNHKKSDNLIDFEDMIEHTISILKSDESIRNDTHNLYRYILVDEFQDTSDNNFELLKSLLPDKGGNLFVVGDDWQSIYGFRKARIEYIVRIRNYFPEAKIITLSENYRSYREIIKLSNGFISKNRFRSSKKLVSTRGKGGVIIGVPVSGFEDEAAAINELIKNEKTNEITVLYRNNWQGDLIRNFCLDTIQALPGKDVKFMTMHASKGLEFPTVIIAGICDAIIPDASTDVEEERRLLYVAITRAKDTLYIVHHVSKGAKPSLFAEELGLSIHG